MWVRDGLRARESPAGRVIELNIAGSLLAAGEYELQIRGLTAAGSSEDVSYYYFVVLKK